MHAVDRPQPIVAALMLDFHYGTSQPSNAEGDKGNELSFSESSLPGNGVARHNRSVE